MRIDATFIVIPYSRLSATTVFPLQSGGINILIDSADFNIATILQYTTEHNNKLLYSLSGDLINNSHFSELIPRIFLLHTLCDTFIKDQGIIPVFLAEAVSSTPLNKLKDYYEQQGEKKIDFAFFEQGNTGMEIKNNLLFLPVSQLELFDNTVFNNLVNQEIYLVFLEAGANVHENKWLQFLFHTVALNRENGWKQYKSSLWQERAKLYLSFIALGKKVGEAEYYNLREWYHNEYEVLPLWFKRLGHIIKVVTGKRSLKSLFPRRVKQP